MAGAHRIVRVLSVLAVLACAVAIVLLGLLHISPTLGGLSPFTDVLSHYAHRPGRWLWDLALIVTAVGSVALLVGMWLAGVLRGVLAVAGMVAWCGGLPLVVLFLKDPQGGAVTMAGKIHLAATIACCVGLAVTGLAIGRRYRSHPEWLRFARWSWWFAVVCLPLFVPFVLPMVGEVLLNQDWQPYLPNGFFERIVAVLDGCLLLLFSVWTWRAADGRSESTGAVQEWAAPVARG
ncbi:uncharacterized protein DUF998 [Tamaricihabitans halophyticus]|uniref:Uncharacterized protein DUF998 n=1 Tax=Tamaricihabitans halophyticus TaxID=1262583 RepID=A0A4R2QYE8_9PSEU|nr:DUF998 domain-containing protein [Tamaricihabitans halophyticus]TCP55272.1 uncharacterized protein DUF998 [Tamaricihabitans halophyticus]